MKAAVKLFLLRTCFVIVFVGMIFCTHIFAQSRDDFSYWDKNGNGDLTCGEVRGLRLPAYKDNRNGTGLLYEWLERGRVSDSDSDGITCESTFRPNGYVPGVVVHEPVQVSEPELRVDTWRGLRVTEERPRKGYNRRAFGNLYSRLEDDIIRELPPTMKANGKAHTPYSCIAFNVRRDGTAATDIEHIVALAEAHDSGIANNRRRNIASDLDNLTISHLTVNRHQKSARDAGEWIPARHGAWFANQVIKVKLKYDLSVDPAERDALELLLAGGAAQLDCVSPVN